MMNCVQIKYINIFLRFFRVYTLLITSNNIMDKVYVEKVLKRNLHFILASHFSRIFISIDNIV